MDYSSPVEIAEDVYWVGCYLPDDPFQCHVYLIRNGDESILIDPGSRLTYATTKRKIESLINLSDIKYIVCHHQDPDIVSCMDQLLNDIGDREKYIVTHWRAWSLLLHYNWNVKLYEVEKNTWRLKAGDRKLRFIFTPYLHFPGAFCSFDEKTRTLFSSDLFGAFTDEFELFAKSVDDYFAKMKPFHEHYMPSNIILNNGLNNIERFQPINLIAPQHGSIIRKELIAPLIERLKVLRCGLFGEFENTKEIVKLSEFNEALREIIEIIAYQENFFNIIEKVLSSLNKFYTIEYIKAFVASDTEKEIIVMDSEEKSVGIYEDSVNVRNMLQAAHYLKQGGVFYHDSHILSLFNIKDTSYVFSVKDRNGKLHGLCFIAFSHNYMNIPLDLEIIRRFEVPLSMAILQEKQLYCMEVKTRQFYEESIRDALTGLFNRYHMSMLIERELERVKRYGSVLSLVMFDLDNFKKVNDTYGHHVGDVVLRTVGYIIKNMTRSIDIPVRYGGEEFLLILPNTDKEKAYKVAEKIRRAVEEREIEVDDAKVRCTISAGIASSDELERGPDGNIYRLIILADKRLYEAKKQGKNRIAL